MEKNNFLSIKIKLGAAEFEAKGPIEDVKASRDSFLGFIKECSEQLPLLHTDSRMIAETSQDSAIIENKEIDSNHGISYSSFNEMKRKLNLSSNTDLVMGAAYYLSAYEGMGTFTSQDIKELFQRTKNKTKINISQFIAQNISKGLIEEVGMSDKKQKEYQILDSANEWLQQLGKAKD